jgi:hypothetical protein
MVFSGNSNKIPEAKDGVIYLKEVSAERFIRIRIVSLPKNFSCRLGDLSRLSQKLRQVCCVSSIRSNVSLWFMIAFSGIRLRFPDDYVLLIS